MIKLEDHRVALINLKYTIDALETIDILIDEYSIDKPGPAYVEFKNLFGAPVSTQFDRTIMVEALKSQRQKLVGYLETLGIEA